MKKWFNILLLPCLLLITSTGYAVHSIQPTSNNQEQVNEQVATQSSLEKTAKKRKTRKKKKGNFLERMALKLAAKKLNKAIQKEKEGKKNTYGAISLGFAGLSLLDLIFQTGALFILGGICALVFGIIGIVKDENKVMAIIGTVYGGATVILTIIALIWVLLLLEDLF